MLPFSYHWIFKKALTGAETILDVGCGDGALMNVLNKNKEFRVTGIDLYKPYLESAKKTGAYSKVMLGDIRKLNFKNKQFDVILCSQVVEHLSKKEAWSLIKEMERIAKWKVIIGTTNGFFPFDPIEGKDENPLQVHKSGWEVSEFREKRYKVYGQGANFVYKPYGLAHKIKQLNLLWFGLSYLLSPINYLFPRFSAYIIAVKHV